MEGLLSLSANRDPWVAPNSEWKANPIVSGFVFPFLVTLWGQRSNLLGEDLRIILSS